MEGEIEEDEEVDTNELLKALQSNENIPIEILHEEPRKESNTVSGKTISLVGISCDENINKETQFLEEIDKVFHQYETSAKFTASRKMPENTY